MRHLQERENARPSLRVRRCPPPPLGPAGLPLSLVDGAGETRFFGDPTPIQKNYLPADFLGESSRYRPLKSVHVQVGVEESQAAQETRWLQGLESVPQGIVGWCDLAAPTLPRDLDAHAAHGRFRGVRQIVGRHPEEDRKHGSDSLLDNPAWLAGLKLLAERGLSFDLQLIPPQLDRARAVLEQVPELPVALCHCGSPWDQSAAGLRHWRAGLERLAELPRVYCKVSGLGMFNPRWHTRDLRPLVLAVIDTFGPERVMFGSNFPVDKLYRSYAELWDAYDAITADFSESERAQLFRRNADAFYRI